MEISFNEIVKLFDPKEWIFSYLLPAEMHEVLNHPVKSNNYLIDDLSQCKVSLQPLYVVALKYSPDFDYSIKDEFLFTTRTSLKLESQEVLCNFKYAAMKAGLGQYAKNSLIYNQAFGFEHHIGVFEIFSDITDLPMRQPANYQLFAGCTGCDDCARACPINAIHFQENGLSWIDMVACDNFAHFNNHEYIPSLKMGWFKHNLPPHLNYLTEEDMKQITSFKEYIDLKPGNMNRPKIIDGKKYMLHYPVCRECTSQKRCSKYGGKYPYDKNDVKYILIEK